MILPHSAWAGLLCTTGLVLLAADGLRDRGATLGRGFLLLYGAAMALWAVLGWRRDSGALALISVAQLASVAALAAREAR